jgi:hypothetical protein
LLLIRVPKPRGDSALGTIGLDGSQAGKAISRQTLQSAQTSEMNPSMMAGCSTGCVDDHCYHGQTKGCPERQLWGHECGSSGNGKSTQWSLNEGDSSPDCSTDCPGIMADSGQAITESVLVKLCRITVQ